MKLTDTQRVLLSTASQREDRGIELAANLKGGAAQKLVRNLLAEGLIEEVGAAGSLAVWRRGKGNRPRALCITERGLAAIRVVECSGRSLARQASGLCCSSKDAHRCSLSTAGQAQPGRLKAGPRDRDAPPPAGSNHCGDHEGDRLAVALGARLLCWGSAQETRPDPCIREDRQGAGLSHYRRESRNEAQGKSGSQGGVTAWLSDRPIAR